MVGRSAQYAQRNMRLAVRIGKLRLKNPVVLASGTCGFGKEVQGLIDINKLGGVITKTITLDRRQGNPPPRIAEVPGGLLNSIGLANEGLKDFIFEKVPYLEKLEIPIIVSIGGNGLNDFERLTEELSSIPCIQAFEINLSCPNISQKDRAPLLLAQDRKTVAKIISRLRKITNCTLIAKLSPSVTDIKEIAKAAQDAGADSLSLVNSYPAMLVDVDTMSPRLGGVTGGLSGPCIKPLALKCVWDVYNAVNIPIIGVGGIMTKEDAVEFFLCGASAVQIGTANFVNPRAPMEILDGIKEYLQKKKIKSVKSLVGKIRI